MRARIAVPGSASWPAGLDDLDEVPAKIWILGQVLPTQPAVAVVGSRNPTLAGSAIAGAIGADLAAAGIQVISGFARGIDAAAHEGCLAAGGSTVAVLGSGLGVKYPRGHDALRYRLTQTGCLLTEYPYAMEPSQWTFPRRNRLIAALSRAVIVVEARARSGALSTARWAADLGRNVLAVPGSIRNQQSLGANLLIRDGAQPYLSIQDVFLALGETMPVADTTLAPGGVRDPLQRRILGLLAHDGIHPDDLQAALGMGAAELGAALTDLELQGRVATLADGLVALALR